MDKKVHKRLKIIYFFMALALVLTIVSYIISENKVFPWLTLFTIFGLFGYVLSWQALEVNGLKREETISKLLFVLAIICAIITLINKNIYFESYIEIFQYCLFVIVLVFTAYNIFENKRTKNI